jgi:NADH dehydrogenase
VILVTGGTGFVGPRIVHAIRAAGKPVRALVRKPSSRAAQQLRSWGCELVEGDVTRPETLREAVAGCEAVVHLVAILTGRPEDFRRVMSDGTRDLVVAAQEAGVRRFVLMSALGTSEETKDLVPYFRAKWDMETVTRDSTLEHVIFRPSFVFGENGGALQQFKRVARLSPVTPIVGPGTQRIQPIWVDDVAAYFAASLDRPDVVNRTFELGGPDVVTWNEFWERLKRALGLRRPSVHIPFGLMRVQATVLERLPTPPVTRDQLAMLELDNVVTNDHAVRVFQLPLVALAEQLRRAA